jgi:hypothetical protein
MAHLALVGYPALVKKSSQINKENFYERLQQNDR